LPSALADGHLMIKTKTVREKAINNKSDSGISDGNEITIKRD